MKTLGGWRDVGGWGDSSPQNSSIYLTIYERAQSCDYRHGSVVARGE